MSQEDFVKDVINIYKKYKDINYISKNYFDRIINIFHNKQINHTKINDVISVEIIILFMKEFPNELNLQVQCSCILKQHLSKCRIDSSYMTEQIVNFGGLELIIENMKKFHQCKLLEEHSISILEYCISDYGYIYNNQVAINKIVDIEGIELIIKKLNTNTCKLLHEQYISILAICICKHELVETKIVDHRLIEECIQVIMKKSERFNVNTYEHINFTKIYDKLIQIQSECKERDKPPDDMIVPSQKKLKTADNSIKIHLIDGKYMTDDGVEFIPSMKALNNTQTTLTVKIEKEEEVQQEDAKTYALFIDKQQTEIDRLKELCKKNNIPL